MKGLLTSRVNQQEINSINRPARSNECMIFDQLLSRVLPPHSPNEKVMGSKLVRHETFFKLIWFHMHFKLLLTTAKIISFNFCLLFRSSHHDLHISRRNLINVARLNWTFSFQFDGKLRFNYFSLKSEMVKQIYPKVK